VCDEGRVICLGCRQLFLQDAVCPSLTASVDDPLYLCHLCYKIECNTIRHMINHHTNADVVTYQKMMRKGYYRRRIDYTFHYIKDPDEIEYVMDIFATYRHSMDTWGTIH
jgi:hypothetical protein